MCTFPRENMWEKDTNGVNLTERKLCKRLNEVEEEIEEQEDLVLAF